jgi:hypothetical protein
MASLALAEDDRHAVFPATVEAMVAYLDYYGFDYFFAHTLSKIDLKDQRYADAVDGALDKHRDDPDLSNFTIGRAFRTILSEVMDDGDFTEDEALEVLAEEDYVIPVTTALYYSVDAGETDVERLSTLIRNRAKRLIRQAQRSRS